MANMANDEEWTSMNDASFRLRSEGINVSVSKLSRLASQGKIKTEEDTLDERVRLVNLNELRALFGSSKRIRN